MWFLLHTVSQDVNDNNIICIHRHRETEQNLVYSYNANRFFPSDNSCSNLCAYAGGNNVCAVTL